MGEKASVGGLLIQNKTARYEKDESEKRSLVPKGKKCRSMDDAMMYSLVAAPLFRFFCAVFLHALNKKN